MIPILNNVFEVTHFNSVESAACHIEYTSKGLPNKLNGAMYILLLMRKKTNIFFKNNAEAQLHKDYPDQAKEICDF